MIRVAQEARSPVDRIALRVAATEILQQDRHAAERTVRERTARFFASAALGELDVDLVLHFATVTTGIACGSTVGVLTGSTFGGTWFEAADTLKTVGCR